MEMQRVVCFKFKESATSVERRGHMDDFRKLKERIPQILSYAAGGVVGKSRDAQPEWDVMHYLTFAGADEVEAYIVAPAHVEFVERNRPLWDSVLVIASDIE